MNDPSVTISPLGNYPTISSQHDPYGGITIGSIDPFSMNDGNLIPIESVKGDMLVVEKKFSLNEIAKSYDQSFVEGVKKEMAFELVDRILQNKYVEFTKQEDLKTGEVIYRARAYITPDDQVRMIRKSEK